MAEYKLKLEKREITGKKLRALRQEGLIPSVVYGGKEPILTASDYVATEKVLRQAGYHSSIDLDIEGKKRLVIVKDVQIDPVKRRILNVEFLAISANEVVETTTPITVVGFAESEAAKTYHFAFLQALEEISVKAKPANLPKEIEIDASKMEKIEDKLTIADIVLPSEVEFADKEIDPTRVIVSLYDPAAEAAAREAAEAAEAAEATEAEAKGDSEETAEAPAETSEKPAEAEEEKE